MLNDIGFNWTAPPKDYIVLWNEKFEQLKLYKSKHGDCNVPKIYEENQSLGRWVHTQRQTYKQLKLSEERINMLNDIGFTWTDSFHSIWLDKFEELKMYKSKHGHCNVKRSDPNQPLANWVKTQRCRDISEERKNMLNEIGFIWAAPPKGRKSTFNRKTGSKKIQKQQNLTVENEIDTELEDSGLEQSPEHLAIESNSNKESRIGEAAMKEKIEKSCTKNMQDSVQVLCKLSLLFQEQKDVIYANMKKRKLENSAFAGELDGINHNRDQVL
ncbi:hypothetical protein CTEN210_18264 [Chaetoceros tenuissimus]|uniref:Helicase-associated domain-containing protein n=1 Tax=Chaetoceros tenuissimus TaxID=426638 RepID=A0AAD3HG48_9STRA|nr:hypothetical protein CTEN210_18264 [Chaetoceros tenuissimus]